MSSKIFKILVYDQNGYVRSISTVGQGPGELSNPRAMTIGGNELHVLNSPNRIEVFSLSGEPIKSVKLSGYESGNVWTLKIVDMVFINESYYCVLSQGKHTVVKFNQNGIYKRPILENIESELPDGLGILYRIYYDDRENEIYICDQFRGIVNVYDIGINALRHRKTINIIESEISNLVDEILQPMKGKKGAGISKFRHYTSTYCSTLGKVILRPYVDNKKGIAPHYYTINRKTYNVEKISMKWDIPELLPYYIFYFQDTSIAGLINWDYEMYTIKGEIK